MSTYWEAFWREWRDGRWEPDTKALLEEILSPGDLFVDVGAWIGPVTLWALELGANVVAIEPDPVAVAELRRTMPDSVEIHECAVTPEARPVRLSARRGELGNSMTHVTADGAVEIEGRELFEILDGRIPKLVTIDIEGYEAELLPKLAPELAAAGVTLQVALHPHVNPAPIRKDWFEGFADVAWPERPRGNLVARP